MKPTTYETAETYNGFKVWYREAGTNSYWVARRYPNCEPAAGYYIVPETYTRKDKGSLVRFIKSKPALKTQETRKF